MATTNVCYRLTVKMDKIKTTLSIWITRLLGKHLVVPVYRFDKQLALLCCTVGVDYII